MRMCRMCHAEPSALGVQHVLVGTRGSELVKVEPRSV
jgi:hypothetical protein